MTVTTQGVSLSFAARRKVVLFLVIAAEAILSLFVYISLSAHILWPEKSKAAVGVANVLSYEGRLMDASGNPLGGTGEPYCFRFSIYDAVSGGSKVWPTGTPATTTATTTDGVFNALVGQADTLDYNFYASDTTFLNVDVYTATSTNGSNCFSGTWETLSPRQRVAATGYARSAENVYSSLLRTDITNSRTQIGSGVGGGSPIMFGLDVKNTNDYVGQACSTSGTLWYNSAISKALVCENGVIQTVSNSGATTTIAAINANAGTPATTGTIVFSNSNGVSFGINGNTITASVNGGVTHSSYEVNSGISASAVLSSNSNTSGAASFFPFYLNGAVAADYLNMALSNSFVTYSNSSGSQSQTLSWGFYSRGTGASTSLLSQMANGSISFGVSAQNSSYTFSQATATNTAGYTYSTTASAGSNISSGYTGMKLLQIPVNSTYTSGMYWLGLFQRISTSSNNGGLRFSFAGQAMGSSLANMAPIGSFSTAFSTGTNATRSIGGNWQFAAGSFTSAGQTNLPSSVAISALTQNINVRPYMYFYDQL